MAKQEARTATPRLRFPEFRQTGDWTTVALGTITRLLTERVGLTDCVPYTVTSGFGLISQQEKLGRTIAGQSLKNYLVLQQDDFAYNKSATKAYPQGFIARYDGSDRAAVPNSIFTCFRIEEDDVHPIFLENLFVSNLHGNWLRGRIAVGARAHGSLNVSDDDLLALPVPLPPITRRSEEQEKIADCLTSLDEVIAAQGRKVEALKAHKRGLMQQLFPREGETRPRLRFPEFRDAPAWEEKSLGTLCESVSSGRDKADIHGNFDLYGSTGTIGKTSVATFRGKFILVARVGANAGLLTVVNGNFGVTDNTIVITLKDSQIIDFIFYYLDAMVLNKMVFGSGQPLITGGQLKALTIRKPYPAEQQRIADCLSSLDTQITAESNHLAALKTHKQGLMQQLFPAPEAMGA